MFDISTLTTLLKISLIFGLSYHFLLQKIMFPSIIYRNFSLKATSNRKGRTEKDLLALRDDPNFKNWLDRFKTNLVGSPFGEKRITAENIIVDDVDMFNTRFGFGKFRVETDPFVPSIVFHRSPSVCVLYLIRVKDQYYGLLTVQARVPAGYRYLPELLAGMIDDHTGKCHLVAVKELEEEAGIIIDPSQLIDLGHPDHFRETRTDVICKTNEKAWEWFSNGDPNKSHLGYFNSPGGSTEETRFYMYEEEMTELELCELVARLETNSHGLKEEGELIKLMLVPIDNLLDIAPDMKVGHALALRERYLKRTPDN